MNVIGTADCVFSLTVARNFEAEKVGVSSFTSSTTIRTCVLTFVGPFGDDVSS